MMWFYTGPQFARMSPRQPSVALRPNGEICWNVGLMEMADTGWKWAVLGCDINPKSDTPKQLLIKVLQDCDLVGRHEITRRKHSSGGPQVIIRAPLFMRQTRLLPKETTACRASWDETKKMITVELPPSVHGQNGVSANG